MPRSGFMYIDLGPTRHWGERFPIRAAAFAAETPPAREVLTDSRTMKGVGAAGVVTLGAAAVEVAQSVLAAIPSAFLPLVSYLDTLRWVFIAAVVGRLAGAAWACAAVRYGATVLAVLLFLLALRRSGERAGRLDYMSDVCAYLPDRIQGSSNGDAVIGPIRHHYRGGFRQRGDDHGVLHRA